MFNTVRRTPRGDGSAVLEVGPVEFLLFQGQLFAAWQAADRVFSLLESREGETLPLDGFQAARHWKAELDEYGHWHNDGPKELRPVSASTLNELYAAALGIELVAA